MEWMGRRGGAAFIAMARQRGEEGAEQAGSAMAVPREG